MSLSELVGRSRSEASKLFDRLTWKPSTAEPRSALRERAPSLADPDAAIRMLLEHAPGRFFAGLEGPAAFDTIRRFMPADGGDVVIEAKEAIASGCLHLLGYRNLWFGDPIDWHVDPVWGCRSPLVHWGRIDPLDTEQVGDSKVVWELNRHQWIVRLAQGWVLTGDPRYAATAVDAIARWLDANPRGTGINWASSLEVAMRLISWCWTLLLLRHSGALSGDRLTPILVAIWEHATHIRRYLSYYFSPNTHLTGEALGLVYAGVLFPEFRDAAQWRTLGAQILIAESDRQISDDGVHFEQSTCYHRYTIEIYLHFLLLAERNGLAVPTQVGERVQRMVEFLIAIRQPDGSIPVIGDADGGTLLPLARREGHDGRGLFAVAAAMYRRQDFAWAASGLAPEVLWLLGDDGRRAFQSIPPEMPRGEPSRTFPAGGYTVMRSGWHRDAHQLIVDTGPLGCPISSGHGHADLLSVQCAVFGEPCLVDPGTYCYTPEPEWRDFFRSTAAHSTIQLDGLGQAEPTGPFSWTRRPQVHLREWQTTPGFDLLDAESDAFACLPDPVVHRRRVLFVKPRYWIIVDDLTGLSTHHLELTFQFAPIAVSIGPRQWARARTASGATLWVAPFSSQPIQPTLRAGELRPIRGWLSPEYGRRIPAPTLTYSADVFLPWRGLTVLMPDLVSNSMPPAVRTVQDDQGRLSGLVFVSSGEFVSVDERSLVAM